MKIQQWQLRKVGEPLELQSRELEPLGDGEVLVRVTGCGVCHTDVGFAFDGVKTRHPLPLCLGHEVSGVVEEVGASAHLPVGEPVIVPAVMPCDSCDLCKAGRGAICKAQIFPGNDIDGGFASHLVVPAAQLCRVPRDAGVPLTHLAVVADAVSTPYQAVRRSGLGEGDVAVFIGVGGVGAFGVQLAAATGATVFAIDIDEARLTLCREHGAAATFLATDDHRALKKQLFQQTRERGLPDTGWRIFETSGTTAGQETAFALLGPDAYLSIIGFTPKPATVPVSRLMAFDARAEGNWGCLPQLYPACLGHVLDGSVQLAPFVETRPMSEVNDVLAAAHAGKLSHRVVLIPDFG